MLEQIKSSDYILVNNLFKENFLNMNIFFQEYAIALIKVDKHKLSLCILITVTKNKQFL